MKKSVTIQRLLFREVFWHEYAKIPRVACKNPIAKGDFFGFLLVTVKVLNSYENHYRKEGVDQ